MSRVKKSVVLLVLVFSVFSILSLASFSFADSGSADIHPLVQEQLENGGSISVIVLLKEERVEMQGRAGERGISGVESQEEEREREEKFLNAKRESARRAKEEFFEDLPEPQPIQPIEAGEGENSVSDEAPRESVRLLREYYSIGAVEVQIDEAGLEALRNNPKVAKVIPNLERRIDDNRGTISDIGISLNESAPVVNSDAVANITVNASNLTGHGEIICVIDTGIDTSHLLFGPVVEASNIVGGVFGGYDFVNNDTNATDDNNHGTHVSGIAVGNFSPYFGTARNAQVVPIKVCNGAGSCPDAAILAGVDYCNNNISGATVLSGSLGGGAPLTSSTCSGDSLYSTLEPLLTTSLSLGIIPVFASGNNGCGAGCTTGVDYPACSPQVISVGSTTKADAISAFTDRGGDRFDIYAPGQSITSSIPTFNAISSVSGTSQATPHVSGAIAVFQQNEREQGRSRINLSVMRQLLQQTGVPIAPNNSRLDMYSVIMKRNLNYSANATSFLIRNDSVNTSILFTTTTNFTGAIGCIDLAPNFAGVNSTSCPQYNKSAHVVLGGVSAPSIPYVDGALCPSSVCANMTITSRGLEMDVQGFSNFTSVPGCPALLNASATLNASIASNESCITLNADNIVLDCAGFTITGTQNGTGVNATSRTNVTIQNCILNNFTNNIVFEGTNSSFITNVSTGNTTQASISLSSSHGNTINASSGIQSAITGTNAGVMLSSSNRNVIVNSSTNTSVNAFWLTGSSYNVLTNNSGQTNGNRGFFLTMSSDNNSLENNVGSSPAGSGFGLYFSTGNNLTNNSAQIGVGGIAFDTSLVNNTRFVNNTGAASFGLNLPGAYNATVLGGAMTGSTGQGVLISGSINVTVDGLTALSTMSHGIRVIDSNSTFIYNARTNATGAAGNGINVDNTGDFMYNITIINSTGGANGTHGIFVSNIMAENGTGLNMSDSAGYSSLGRGIELGSNLQNGIVTRSNGTSELERGFGISNVDNLTVLHSIANNTNNGSQGFLVGSCDNCLMQNNTGASNGGFFFDNGMNSIVRDNRGFGVGDSGLRFSGTNHTFINNSGITSTGIGMQVTTTNGTVSNNSGSGQTGIEVSSVGTQFNLNSGTGTSKGMRVAASAVNNTIANGTLTAPGTGLELDQSSNNTYVNITATSTNLGIDLLFAHNNSFTRIFGQGGSNYGIRLQGSHQNQISDSRAQSDSDGGIYFVSTSNLTVLVNNTFASNTEDAVSFGLSGGSDNAFYNTTLETNDTWINVENTPSSGNNFTNTTFNDSSGSVRILGNFTMPTVSLNRSNVNMSLNRTFINATTHPFLNQSAQITLRGLTFSNARPMVDVNDSGVFEQCDVSRCTTISYGAGTFVFNVTSFTSYASEESGGVSISKADSEDPVVRGALFNYTIIVNNSNNVSIFNVTVNDTYPQGVAFVSAQPTPTGNATFTIGTLAANTSFQINISVRAGSNLANGTILNNSARVVFAPSNGTNSSVNVSELTTIRGIPTILTTKTDSPDPIPRGTTLTYQITINNTGDEVAYNVTVTEGYPANTDFNNASPAPTSGNNSFLIGNLTPNQSTTINITLNVSPSLANGSILNNSYNLSLENLTGGVQTITNSTTTTVLGSPNISAVKTDSIDPVFAGDQFVYRITLNNTGDDTAFNITVTEGYPSGVSFVSAQPTPTGNNTFTISNLSPSAQFIINITLAVGSDQINGTLLNNTINVTFANRSGENAAANASENTTVIQPPALTVNKTVNQTTVVKGTTSNYTITVTNTGSSTAFNVTVLELYPTGVAFISSEPTPTSGNGTFNVGDLLPNQSTTINLTINFSAALANGTIKNNSLNITANRSDGRNVTPQNTSAVVTVVGFPQVSVVKSDTPDPVVNGTTLTYVITITNSGDEIAYNVTATEGYPANVSLLTTQPTPTPDNATFPIGNLLPGQTFLINITVNVSGGMISGQLNNSVNVTFANASGVSVTLSNSTLTTATPPPVPFVGGGGGGGGGGGAGAGVSTSQSMSGNSMTTNYLRAGDKVTFAVQSIDHTMTVLTVLNDRVSIRVASVPQEFIIKKGVVQAVDVTGDGQTDIRISVTDIAYSKALFYLEKAAFSPAVVREPTPAPVPTPALAPTPAPEPVPAQVPVPEVLREPLPEVVPQGGSGSSGSSSSWIMLAGALLVIAAVVGVVFFKKSQGDSQASLMQSSQSPSAQISRPAPALQQPKQVQKQQSSRVSVPPPASKSPFSSLSAWWNSSSKPSNALDEAKKIEEALKEMKRGVKESEHLMKKAEKLDRKGKR